MTTVLLICWVLTLVCGFALAACCVHWKRAADSARARLADERVEAHAEQARIIAALITTYGHNAALVALDAAARPRETVA